MKVMNRLMQWLGTSGKKHPLQDLFDLDGNLESLRKRHSELSKQIRNSIAHGYPDRESAIELQELERYARALRDKRELLVSRVIVMEVAKMTAAPQLGERILLLILTKEERVNILGDLEEEYRGIAAKHGARYAKLWYYKQVGGSAWPLIRKVIGWGGVTGIGEWFRRHI